MRLAIAAAILLAFAPAELSGIAGELPASPPASVRLIVDGKATCWATPGQWGYWTARHCIQSPTRVVVSGRGRLPFSADPRRDLAHVGASDVSVPLGVAREGDVLYWRWADGTHGGYVADGRDRDGLRICHLAGPDLVAGGSGTGLWLDSGHLVAILARYERDPDTASCSAERAAWAVEVP